MRQPESNPAQPEPKDGMPIEWAEFLAWKADREERLRERGAFWLTPEGRAKLREAWPDPDDTDAVPVLLNALESAEAALAAPPSPEPQPKTEKADKCPACNGSKVIGIPGVECPFCKLWATAQAPESDSPCAHPNMVTQYQGDGRPVEFCPDCGRNFLSGSAPAASTAEPLELTDQQILDCFWALEPMEAIRRGDNEGARLAAGRAIAREAVRAALGRESDFSGQRYTLAGLYWNEKAKADAVARERDSLRTALREIADLEAPEIDRALLMPVRMARAALEKKQ